VARCTVERLMRELGLAGARRGKRKRTTVPDLAAARSADLVGRRFSPAAPDRLWVADFTYVPTWSGMVYVAFVIDAYSRQILGWRAATSMRTALVLDALEQAIWTRQRGGAAGLAGLVHHTDGGSQGGFNWSSQHLDLEVLRYGCREAPAGDSCDARTDVVARQAIDRAARGSRAVLGGDRPRRVERGRGSRDECVAGRWLEVVPAGWRDAAHLAGPAVGAVPVVR
jgi:putative transposase